MDDLTISGQSACIELGSDKLFEITQLRDKVLAMQGQSCVLAKVLDCLAGHALPRIFSEDTL